MLSAEVMRRTLALAVLFAILSPIAAPILEAATSHCGTVSTCCMPVGDHCGMTMCAATREPATQAVRIATIAVDLEIVQTVETIAAPSVEHHETASPPPPTRLRLARLETLLI
jgi:hypothetical protein